MMTFSFFFLSPSPQLWQQMTWSLAHLLRYRYPTFLFFLICHNDVRWQNRGKLQLEGKWLCEFIGPTVQHRFRYGSARRKHSALPTLRHHQSSVTTAQHIVHYSRRKWIVNSHICMLPLLTPDIRYLYKSFLFISSWILLYIIASQKMMIL